MIFIFKELELMIFVLDQINYVNYCVNDCFIDINDYFSN